MAHTNHLQSHCPERHNRRADKMGSPGVWLRQQSAATKRVFKQLYQRKQRQFLKNPQSLLKL